MSYILKFISVKFPSKPMTLYEFKNYGEGQVNEIKIQLKNFVSEEITEKICAIFYSKWCHLVYEVYKSSQVKSSLLYCQFFHMYSTYIQRTEIALLSDPWCIQLTLNTDSRHSKGYKMALLCSDAVQVAPLRLCFYLLFYLLLLSLFTHITSALITYDKGTLLDIGHRYTNLLQDT